MNMGAMQYGEFWRSEVLESTWLDAWSNIVRPTAGGKYRRCQKDRQRTAEIATVKADQDGGFSVKRVDCKPNRETMVENFDLLGAFVAFQS